MITGEPVGQCGRVPARLTLPRITTVVVGRRPDGSRLSDGLPADVDFARNSYRDPAPDSKHDPAHLEAMTATTVTRPGLGNGRRRKPKGAPTGGQFDHEHKAESEVDLAVAAPDVDGTPTDQPRCVRCGKPGGVHECAIPVADDPSTSFRYTQVGRRDRAERLEEDLMTAIEEVVSSGRLQRWLDRISTNRLGRWSFSNQMLALVQIEGRRAQMVSDGTQAENLPPVMVMTAAAWEREFGRHPKAGESAIWINGPRTRKVTVTDPTSGQETEDRRFVGVSPVAEFDITQTEGPDVPNVDIATMTDGRVRPGSFSGLRDRIEAAGYTLQLHNTATLDPRNGGGAFGWTDPTTKTVRVDPRLTDSQKVETMAHELAHILHGHVNTPADYQRHRGRMETEAEASAYMIRRWLGADDDTADHTSFSPGYIAGWSRGDVKQVKQAMNASTKVFQQVIDGAWPDTD